MPFADARRLTGVPAFHKIKHDLLTSAPPSAPGVAPGPAGPGRPPARRWTATVLALLAGLALAGLGVGAVWVLTPPPALRAGPRVVEVPANLGLLGIATVLAEGEVIRHELGFVALAVLRGTARSLKAGEYEVPRGASLLTTLRLLEVGRVKPHLVVLNAGGTIRDLARQLEAERLAPAAEVLRLADTPWFVQEFGLGVDRLEGYLYPDTYQVTKGMRIDEILGRMVQRFREQVGTPDVLARARARGLSLHELVTFASIVEKEAALAEERPVIAAVFWNRLKRDMPLQADPTVSYALGRDGAPTRADLLVDHPFNTYRNRGLPPGPIASPGRAAVEAVLAPADVPYLYFVSMDGRQHEFSTTLEEHQQAVIRYRQARARARPF
jgi:UPF0755 protein